MTFAGFDHIDLRVADLPAARAMYDVLLPALGLSKISETAQTCEYSAPAEPGEARRFFELNLEPGHRANATRICFTAISAGDVDRLGEVVRQAGALAVEGPEILYSADMYYAVFFEDPSGNKLEIAYRRPPLARSVELSDAQEGMPDQIASPETPA